MPGFNPADPEKFLPVIFGRAFEKITIEYLNGIGIFLAPLFHIMAVLFLFYKLKNKNKNNRIFNIWFTINFLWIFFYVGIYMLYLFYKAMGLWSLAFWGIIPFLLVNILLNWISESQDPKTDWDFSNIHKWRLIIIPIIVFGFWYPTFIYGKGFVLSAKDLLFSFFGLMPCPTTMVILGLLTIKYPLVNKKLFML
jgi:hypothetical protein